MLKIIPIEELENTNTISDMCNNSKEPFFVTKDGYVDMVIMSLATYEEKMSKLDLYEKLAISEKQFEDGKTKDARKALNNLKEKI